MFVCGEIVAVQTDLHGEVVKPDGLDDQAKFRRLIEEAAEMWVILGSHEDTDGAALVYVGGTQERILDQVNHAIGDPAPDGVPEPIWLAFLAFDRSSHDICGCHG